MRVGGSHPPSFTIFTIAYKDVVYAPAERADKLPPYFISIPMYSVAMLRNLGHMQLDQILKYGKRESTPTAISLAH